MSILDLLLLLMIMYWLRAKDLAFNNSISSILSSLMMIPLDFSVATGVESVKNALISLGNHF